VTNPESGSPTPDPNQQIRDLQQENTWLQHEAEQPRPKTSDEISIEIDSAYAEDDRLKLQSKLDEAKFLQRHERNQKEALLRETLTDQLTELPNRKAFDTWLNAKLNEGSEEVWVGFIDLDHFKEINDTYGHERADQLLQYVASVLASQIRVQQDIVGNMPDAMASRRSGDEFLIGIDGAPEERIRQISEKVLEAMNAKMLDSHGNLVDADPSRTDLQPLQMSLGFAQSGRGALAVEVIDNADTAMQKAKKLGRNQYVIF
jgi:diguanylate cyclase (GGDEF)-like protein